MYTCFFHFYCPTFHLDTINDNIHVCISTVLRLDLSPILLSFCLTAEILHRLNVTTICMHPRNKANIACAWINYVMFVRVPYCLYIQLSQK